MTSKSNETNGFFKALVTEVGVDFRRRHLSMAKRPLHQSQVPGHPVEPRGKRVAHCVDRGLMFYSGFCNPLGDAVLDLASAQSSARTCLEEWGGAANSMSINMRGEDSPQRGIDKNRLGSASFGSDIDRVLFEIDIGCVKTHQGSQSDSGSQQQRNDGEIPLGKWVREPRDGIKQGFAFRIREGDGCLSLTGLRFHESGRIVISQTRHVQKGEEGPDGALKAVDRYGGSGFAACGRKGSIGREKSRHVSGPDSFDPLLSANPSGKEAELSHIGGEGVRAPAVGPKLGLVTLYGLIDSHEAPPILDIPSHIHEYNPRGVKFIMRTSGELTAGIIAENASHRPHKRPAFARCGANALMVGQ